MNQEHSTARIIVELLQQVASTEDPKEWPIDPVEWETWDWDGIRTVIRRYTLRVNGASNAADPHQLLDVADEDSSVVRHLNNADNFVTHFTQLRIRGLPYAQTACRADLIQIGFLLDTVCRLEISFEGATYVIHGAHQQNAPIAIHQDQQNRWEWTMTVQSTVTREEL